MLIREEILAENSTGGQFTFGPCQVRCSIRRVEFGEIRRDLKPFKEVGYLLLERTLLLRQRRRFMGQIWKNG